jgi:hypothetical protein
VEQPLNSIKSTKKDKLEHFFNVLSFAFAFLILNISTIFLFAHFIEYFQNVNFSSENREATYTKPEILGDVATSVTVTVCGNGVKETTEECDGSDFGTLTCVSFGYSYGTLSCTSSCTVNTSGCSSAAVCGNGIKEGGEQCDRYDLGVATCPTFGYAYGTLHCYTNCTYNLSSCSHTLPTTSTTTYYSGTTSISTSTTQTTTIVSPESIDTDKDGLPDSWEDAFSCMKKLIPDAQLDYDNDGLTNYQEYLFRTNPCESDTDHDGMPDKWEIDNKLDPLINDAQGDPDKDGYTNIEEYRNSTNPNVFNTGKEQQEQLPKTGEEGKKLSDYLQWKFIIPCCSSLLVIGGIFFLAFKRRKKKDKDEYNNNVFSS